jgi:hypothetical protein
MEGARGMTGSAQVSAVCRPNTHDCCRYLCMNQNGWQCGKLSERLRAYIDDKVGKGEWRAKGDNCDGMDL